MEGQQTACIFILSILLIDLVGQHAFFFSYIKRVFFQISDNQTGIITVYLGASVLPIL